jgi:hypothetical protein
MSFNPDKTEIMLFSNTEIPELNFTFNGRTIPITNSHKHLGVTFSSDAKWNINIENILSSIYKHLNVLRKLKYKLSRKNLEKLYLVYIRPIFEYASELWDLPLNVKFNSGISVFEKNIISVLSGLKDINHFIEHSSSSFRS